MDISNQIKKFRQRDGYSQEFLAEKCLFQDKRYLTGKIIRAILIFIIYS